MINESQVIKIKELVEAYADATYDLAVAEVDYSGLSKREPRLAQDDALYNLNTYLETLLND